MPPGQLAADAAKVLLARDLEARAATRYERHVKPALDRLVASVLLVALLPLLCLVAIAVGISLGRPLFFRQERVGLHGKTFQVLKFRSMRPDRRGGGAAAAPWDCSDRRRTHKHPEDPRLTLVGRIIRRRSLDELPQLWNVVRGDMSLVGPRPEILPIVERYEPWQHRRHDVRPGLTGLWQVTERASGREMHEHVELDLAYVAHLSPGLDARLLVLTVPALLGGGLGH